MGAPEMKRPVPPASGNRANISRNGNHHISAAPEPEEDFVAAYLARRYGLPLPMARTIAALANLSGALA